MKKNIQWLIPVLGCIAASVASVFLPVLTYRYPYGGRSKFNIIDFIRSSPKFVDILAEYDGLLKMRVDEVWLTILAVLAVMAIVAAFVGVITMSLQRPNTWQFVLALVGIIGAAIPAILIFVAALLFRDFLPGVFQAGVYPIVTPIAMVLCLITVTRKHKKNKAEQKAEGLLRIGGDL